MILARTLKNDLAKYTKDTEQGYDSDSEFTDETGWKQIRGDVFRAPPFLSALSAFIGTGWQLIILVFVLIIFAIIGTYYDDRGAILTAFVIMYAITSFISGYFSSKHYIQYNGKNWKWTMFLTSILFPGTCALVGAVLNTISIGYNSLMAVSFGYLMIIGTSWAFISVPLVILGTIIGRNFNSEVSHPCRVSQFSTPIPLRSWYYNRLFIILLSGLLPFGSIFIEMYFIFTSFWNFNFIMFMVFYY